MRAAAGIFAGAFGRRGKLRVDVHGKSVFTFAGVSDGFDITRVVPGHEDFVGRISERFGPVFAVLVEMGCQLGRELRAFGDEGAQQCVRHTPAK